MKFSGAELFDLAKPDGGRFCIDGERAAFDFCKRLALAHYENFPVGSVLIPAKLRPHFYSVYAFSRIADDLGDECASFDITKRLEALQQFELLIDDKNRRGNPIFTALDATRNKFSIPTSLFYRLIEAFRRDAQFSQPQTFADLIEYCSYSANPVGEIVLHLADAANPESIRLSDKICTALQLANLWQDISLDFSRNRMYLPIDLVGKAIYEKDYLHSDYFRRIFLQVFPRLASLTDEMFEQGKELLPLLPYKRLRWEIATTIGGGRSILKKTEKIGLRILSERPILTFLDGCSIACNILTKR